ncbi:MAG: hypothetical protein FD163_616 [Hyphomonadaceae bacterium]|nr:MAG: hypothetical protein FD163_616 [Hyphomonadaceae bacterium]
MIRYEEPDEDNLNQIIQSISEGRLSKYLYVAAQDKQRALKLYMWNTLLCEAFYIIIQTVEVNLRNKINAGLVSSFGENWWEHPRFRKAIESERLRDLEITIQRIMNSNKQINNRRIVAGLSFGFWSAMLGDRYNQYIWSKHFVNIFTESTGKFDRKKLRQEITKIVALRNKISHHEPIFQDNLHEHYSRVMKTNYWLCPPTADWAKKLCRVPMLIRQKPK